MKYLTKTCILILFLTFSLSGLSYAFRPPEEKQSETQTENALSIPQLSPYQKEAPGITKGAFGSMLIGLPAIRITDQSLVDAALFFLATYSGFPLEINQLKLKYFAIIPKESGDKIAIVQFEQKVNEDGRELEVEGSYVDLTILISEDNEQLGTVVKFEFGVFPDIEQILPPKISQDTKILREQAAKALGLSPEQTQITPIKEEILVRYIEGKGWKRVYEASFAEETGEKIGLTAVVNSDDPREIFGWRDDRLFFKPYISGRVQGRGVRFNPRRTGSNLDTLNLNNLKLIENGGNIAYTQENGWFKFPMLTNPTAVHTALTGRWATIASASSPNFILSGNAVPGTPLNLMFNQKPGAPEFETTQVNGYFHTDFVHDWLKLRLPPSRPNQGIDWALPVFVNLPPSIFYCNAFYSMSGASIYFYQSSPGLCTYAAYDTIIYHEYGHFLDAMYGGITDFGLSEGWGDTVATYVTGQPLIGEDFLGKNIHVRTADNTYQYPLDGRDEVHNLGQAWAGFAWHLRRNLIARYGIPQGVNVAEALIIPIILFNSRDIPAAVFDTILHDDDDENLGNGTPHLSEILAAAGEHGLRILRTGSVAKILAPSQGVRINRNRSPITIVGTADTTSIQADFQDYQLFYGIGLNPASFYQIGPPIPTPVYNGTLGTWDISGLLSGIHTLALLVNTRNGLQFADLVEVIIELGTERQITSDPERQALAVISGDKIVWEDYRNGFNNPDIYLYDITLNREQQITTNTAAQRNPAIYGDKIVWEDYRNGAPDIYLYDLINGREQQITTDSAGQQNPAIYGDKIVWEDYRNGITNRDIYLYNLSTGIEQQITTHSASQVKPSIWGNYIVYEDWRAAFPNTDIYLYNVATGREQPITTYAGRQENPAISSDKIVWTDWRNGAADVYLYDISTNREQQITTNVESQLNPAIDGNWIVWEDNRNEFNNFDIYLYDIATGQEQQITANISEQRNPAIVGNNIVWEDNRNGNSDIYLHQLP